jgi:arylsulfatase A-like enzyme
MPSERPNFIIVYTDDHGYGDLGCMGSRDLKTPHLDALAASGALLTDWYSNSPVCSPSRAALLTGRYPCHAGVRAILAGHRQASGLPPEVPTIADALKPLGYHTALFGKWHLGVAEQCRPHHHGFDEWMGFLAGCIDYYSHIFYWGMNKGPGTDPVHDLWENGREVYDNGRYFTEMITERALDYVDRRAYDGQPFLMYVAYNAPHYPMHAPEKYMQRFAGLPWERQVMAAMLAAVDDGVGAVVQELERRGMRENTFIFFSSDNGPSRETRNWLDGTDRPYPGGTPGPLRGHKFSLFEGGIRMPTIMSWPGHIPAGQTIREVGATMDVFPTFLRAAGGDPAEYTLDGADVLPMVTAGATSPHDCVFWEMNKQTAVRQGRWKLVLNGQLVEGLPPEDAVYLSDLEADPGETTNLAATQPQIAAKLQAAAEQWRVGIEQHWADHFADAGKRLTGHN